MPFLLSAVSNLFAVEVSVGAFGIPNRKGSEYIRRKLGSNPRGGQQREKLAEVIQNGRRSEKRNHEQKEEINLLFIFSFVNDVTAPCGFDD